MEEDVKKRTRSGELGEPGSPQDCSLHTCKRKKGNNQEEDRDEEKIKRGEGVYLAGKKWTKRKGIWVKNSTGQEKEMREIDPDLASQHNEGEKSKKIMDWIQVNGNWKKTLKKILTLRQILWKKTLISQKIKVQKKP